MRRGAAVELGDRRVPVYRDGQVDLGAFENTRRVSSRCHCARRRSGPGWMMRPGRSLQEGRSGPPGVRHRCRSRLPTQTRPSRLQRALLSAWRVTGRYQGSSSARLWVRSETPHFRQAACQAKERRDKLWRSRRGALGDPDRAALPFDCGRRAVQFRTTVQADAPSGSRSSQR